MAFMQKVLLDPTDACSLSGGTSLRCNPQEPKPCIHPLVTPSRRVISGFEPSDHQWHRGLWFALKYIDEDNFWEEMDAFGRQVSTGHPQATCDEQGIWSFENELQWVRPSGAVALVEKRLIQVEHAEEAVRIDWQSHLTPQEDLHLDRTPFTTWGGYSGLGWRACRELHDVRFLGPEGEFEMRTGEPSPWLAADGLLDGPFVQGQPAAAGLLMVVDPGHPRFPVPFYAKSNQGFTFMNPAFLFHEGLDVKQGEVLDLRYRIVTVDGRWGENLETEVQRAVEVFA